MVCGQIIIFMNSEERHEARYKRRKAKRELKKQFKQKRYNVESFASLNHLSKAAKQCTRGVKWKVSVQRYDYNRLYYITKSRQEILQHKKLAKGFVCFTLVERGKARNIKATKIEERTIQKSLCQNVLLPYIKQKLIYDNGACLKGKGCDFALDRTAKHLADYYKHSGTNKGYILLFDFKSYFDSIPTTTLLEMLLKDFYWDDDIKYVISQFILAFKKYGDVGIGLGSEISQICAVYYLNGLDHLMKDVLHVNGYNRYMDDGYAIFNLKEEAMIAKEIMEEYLPDFGLKFNQKKTQIVKIRKGFKFLKVRFVLKSNGKVVRYVNKDRFLRERRKLKKFKRFVDEGVMTMDAVCLQVKSMIGSIKGYKCYYAKLEIKDLFNELFEEYGRRININGKYRNIDTSTT